jgi:hypothetical protein
MNIRSNFDVLQNKVTRLNSLVQYTDNFKSQKNLILSPKTRKTEDIDIEFYKDSNFFNNTIREDKLDLQIRKTKEKLSNYLNSSNYLSKWMDTSNLFSTR